MAIAVAAGANMFNGKWTAKPRSVLYIDGDMSPQSIQERIMMIIKGIGIDVPEDNLNNKIYYLDNKEDAWKLAESMLPKHIVEADKQKL